MLPYCPNRYPWRIQLDRCSRLGDIKVKTLAHWAWILVNLVRWAHTVPTTRPTKRGSMLVKNVINLTFLNQSSLCLSVSLFLNFGFCRSGPFKRSRNSFWALLWSINKHWRCKYGQWPNVVYDLVKKANIPKGSHIYMDNLFTSFPLLNKLSEMEIGGTGTMRQNRLNNVPIMNKKDLEKKLSLEEPAMHVFNRI